MAEESDNTDKPCIDTDVICAVMYDVDVKYDNERGPHRPINMVTNPAPLVPRGDCAQKGFTQSCTG